MAANTLVWNKNKDFKKMKISIDCFSGMTSLVYSKLLVILLAFKLSRKSCLSWFMLLAIFVIFV